MKVDQTLRCGSQWEDNFNKKLPSQGRERKRKFLCFADCGPVTCGDILKAFQLPKPKDAINQERLLLWDGSQHTEDCRKLVHSVGKHLKKACGRPNLTKTHENWAPTVYLSLRKKKKNLRLGVYK